MMIICPACRAAHVQGTLFCEQCGTSLIGVAPVEESGVGTLAFSPPAAEPRALEMTLPAARHTESDNGSRPTVVGDRLPAASLPAAPPAPPETEAHGPDENPSTLPLGGPAERDTGRLAVGSVPTRLRVLVLNTGRLTDWIDDPVIHVGRTDRSANVFPTIDLEIDGGHNAGVSRRHTRISRQPDGYYLEDLGSINGTFLNRRRLGPGNATELKDGDEVRMGNIVLRIVLGGYQRSH